MSDFDLNNKVVQANELVREANWTLDTISLKLFKTLVSCINTLDPPEDNTVSMSKKELYDLLGSDSKNNYDYLKNKLRALQGTTIKLHDNAEEESYITLITKTVWRKKENTVSCTFNEEIMPYLIEMHALFLQYEVGNIKKIDTKYGLILYEYLLSMARQEQATTTNPKYEYKISMQRLRGLTGTEKKYARFEAFERKVLKTAEKDINTAGVEFLMRYTKNKTGRSVEEISFNIRVRTSILEDKFFEIKNPNLMDQPI